MNSRTLLNTSSDRVVEPVELVLKVYDQSNYASDYMQYDENNRVDYSRNGAKVFSIANMYRHLTV